MKSRLKEFKLFGLELIEKPILRYKNSSNRIFVPKNWEKVILIRIE